jgi:hypothetical protein
MIWFAFWAEYWTCVFAVPRAPRPTAEIIVLSSRRRTRK